ncbi:MAG: glycosyltransferase family 2 protein [Candidatus Omnitrophica bacterium]|nr:glycosyltransferase family 2 protein [Candidatus Omnitrophota bacterium]
MLAIIIVNYKNEERTIRYAAEELTKITIPHLIVIVNNSANEESNKILSERLKADIVSKKEYVISKGQKIFILPSHNNIGFAKGNNLGFQFCKTYFDPEYVLFTNNDIVFTSDKVVEKLICKLNTLPDVGLIGPEIVGSDGAKQSPEPFVPFWDRFFWLYWLTPFLSMEKKRIRFRLNYSEKAEEGIHYKVMGAFFLMRASDFEKCGMMDPHTFLFAEETILSERLKNIGKNVYYYPKVQVLHEHGKTISNHLTDRRKLLTMFDSESHYYRSYRGINSFQIFCAKLSILLYLFIKRTKGK